MSFKRERHMFSLIMQSNYTVWLSQVTYYFFSQKKSLEKEAFIFIFVAFTFLFLYAFESWTSCMFVWISCFYKQKVEHHTFVNFISLTHTHTLPCLSYKMILLEQLPPHPFFLGNWAIFAQNLYKKKKLQPIERSRKKRGHKPSGRSSQVIFTRQRSNDVTSC